jgi:hypothetical protein
MMQASSTSRIKLDRRAPKIDKDSGMFKYFKVSSHEQYLKQAAQESQQVTELHAKVQEQELQKLVIRKEHKQDQACKCKQ